MCSLPGGRLAGSPSAGGGRRVDHIRQPGLHHPDPAVQTGPGLVTLPVHLAHVAREANHNVPEPGSQTGVSLPALGHRPGNRGWGQLGNL